MNELPEHCISNDAAELESEEYLRGVKSSTCLLLPTTPSPSPMDFKHPLEEDTNENIFLNLCDNPKIIDLQNSGSAEGSQHGDSSSSADSNSVVQDPISAQLINNISMLDYQTLSKNGDIIMGEPETCKLNGSLGGGQKLPNFVNWNWPLIRKFLLWFVVSGLIGCLAAIIAMVITIPKTCNPDLPWYHGKVFYEIFPASFKDSNNDGIGDLKGLIKKLDYVQSMGGSAIRLNYIFEANNYPEQYYNTTSLLSIDRSLGVLKDFQDLVTAAHEKDISVILDIPVLNMVKSYDSLESNSSLVFPKDVTHDLDQTSAAIAFWARAQHVDGFYLKNLEKFVNEPDFGKSLQYWKHIIGVGKIFIANEKALNNVMDDNKQVFLNRIDLVDVHLDLEEGIDGLKNHIDKVVSSTLWEKPYYPWVHWNIGNIDTERISTRHKNNSLALLVMEMVLPGTVSLFYGDEIGLTGLPEKEVEGDFHEHKYIHNLVPMAFAQSDESDNVAILPWNSKPVSEPEFHYLSIIKTLIELRVNTPTIYLRAIYKDGIVMKNMEIRKTDKNLIVIERWYPRRNTCVFVGNLGNVPITTDLSTMFYGGTVVASTNTSLIGEVIYFDKVTFLPNSAIILKLEK
ncbi:uncharacterized protein LOC121735247 [Aricia agestis]|uniref:uncharacterized protein LOC121735247 n=1 Tax=Aricia agestis TaxID=91739 RepID=UPI001C2039A0|nr:uncharacterized protein LOC121735247 [Aricia agestis]XP_041981948.1 uncharacterized protein LOC121735247 [Aricia agestis]